MTEKLVRTYLRQEQLIEILRNRIKYGVSQVDIAKQLGVSRSFLSEVLAGKKNIGTLIPKKMGYDIIYRKRK